MTAIHSDKVKQGSVKLDMSGSLRASFQSDEGFVDEVTADESFSEVSIDEEAMLMKNPEQSALFDYLTSRFQTNSPFTKRSETPGTHHVSDAIAAFRYTQRFYIELNELSGAYFTEYIRPHKRGAIMKMTCHGSFTQSFVYLVFPCGEDGPVIAYRSCYFRVANDEEKKVDEEATIERITRFDDILSVQLPRGLSSECALDARYLIYFLQHYGNEPLEGLPEVGDIPAYMKVYLPVNKDFKRGTNKGKKKKNKHNAKHNKEEEHDSTMDEDYVLVFEDRPCTAFLELNRDLWNNNLAKVSPKYHEHDGDIEKRTISIVNTDPDSSRVGKKKFDDPYHTTLRLEPHLEDIGEGWKFFACMLLLLSHTISINHGEIYLARCVRACYGLKKFDEVVQKASAAQPYLLRKLAALRGACFMARSERIYIDHTDLQFKDVHPPSEDEHPLGDNSGIDLETPVHRNPTDDLQMTIVPITHKLGSLHGSSKTLKLETQYGFALGKLFLICLSHETYGGYSRAENTFGTYISQTKKTCTPDPTPSSRFRLLDWTEISRIRNDWMQLLTADQRLPGVAIHVSENGTKNITVPEFEENGHIQWMQDYSFWHAIVVLVGLIGATFGAWILETGAFHLILALLFVDLVKAEVGLFGALELLAKGSGQAGPHFGLMERYLRIICIVVLGGVEVISNVPAWSAAFQPYVIASGALIGTVLLLPLLARTKFSIVSDGGLTFEDVMARDGSLACVLSPQKGGAYRGCDREGAHGLGLLQAQNFDEVYDHDGSVATTLASPGPRLGYWVSSGLKA